MNKQDRKVLACVDQSHFADAVADSQLSRRRRELEQPVKPDAVVRSFV